MTFIDSLTVVCNKTPPELLGAIKEFSKKMAGNFEIVKVPFGHTGNNILYFKKKL